MNFRIYYQHNIERLSTCPLTVHALLHLADDIENNGPPCMNWTFVMERWCGRLLPAVKSRVYPYKSLTRRQVAICKGLTLLHYNSDYSDIYIMLHHHNSHYSDVFISLFICAEICKLHIYTSE
ncbi:uncharacterized protein EI90DRAFT_2931073 [Cantharellus anzutake]|uniref:uncharacterized protein n=1 Tax=Cantharellus anzutake TaxID=1750568 RepID=UPI001904AC8A|nr:uncharacterized protein EI90DRAFT_2931073 [Cantharellus anzutake]KAF8325832.1 hypothetical protein EI90DRAFT_2931073 [Cantharellus anzutake]